MTDMSTFKLRNEKIIKYLTFWCLEVDSDKWTQIAFSVLKGEVIAGKAAMRVVLDRTNVFCVSWILALAIHPHSIHLEHQTK